MLTVSTPGAQDARADVKAAFPPSETPYPTELGTAMTGAATRPASTLKSAPSIPATAITTRSARMAEPLFQHLNYLGQTVQGLSDGQQQLAGGLRRAIK